MKVRSQLKAFSIIMLLSASTTYPMARVKSAIAFFSNKLPSKESMIQAAVNVPSTIERTLQSPKMQSALNQTSRIFSQAKDFARNKPYVIEAPILLGSTAYAIKEGGPVFNPKYGITGVRAFAKNNEQAQLPALEQELKDSKQERIEVQELPKNNPVVQSNEAQALDQAATELMKSLKKSVTIAEDKNTIHVIPSRLVSPNHEINNIHESEETTLTFNQAIINREALYDAVRKNDLTKVNEIIGLLNTLEEVNACITAADAQENSPYLLAHTLGLDYADIVLALQNKISQALQ